MSTNVQDAAKTQNNHSRTFQIVVFRLGHEEYALPIAQIKEVVQTPSITNIPQSPECIKGVSNIRGNIIASKNDSASEKKQARPATNVATTRSSLKATN
jgi:purine-binding chemotaxis protein CheW